MAAQVAEDQLKRADEIAAKARLRLDEDATERSALGALDLVEQLLKTRTSTLRSTDSAVLERRDDLVPVALRPPPAHGDQLSESALIVPAMMVLGMATAPHAVIARYPSKTTSPRTLYRPDYPAVQSLPKLATICSALLQSVRELCKLAARLPAILSMPGGVPTKIERAGAPP